MRILLLLALTMLLACSKQPSSDTESSGTPPGGGGNGAGTAFSASDLNGGSSKSWWTACTALTDAQLGTTYTKMEYTFYSNGNFNFDQYMYIDSSCGNPYYDVIFSVDGTYSVSSTQSANGQAITLSVSVGSSNPSIMLTNAVGGPTVTALENIFNNDCGGTSPYCTLSGGTCTNNGTYTAGQHAPSKNMTCQHYTFPNAGASTVYNLGKLSGTTLYMGSGATGTPGSLTATPTTTSLTFN